MSLLAFFILYVLYIVILKFTIKNNESNNSKSISSSVIIAFVSCLIQYLINLLSFVFVDVLMGPDQYFVCAVVDVLIPVIISFCTIMLISRRFGCVAKPAWWIYVISAIVVIIAFPFYIENFKRNLDFIMMLEEDSSSFFDLFSAGGSKAIKYFVDFCIALPPVLCGVYMIINKQTNNNK